MGALHGPALLPWAPSSSRSPLPAPTLQLRQTKNHPQTPASPTVGAGGARPRRPVPPAVTGSCKVRERRRRRRLQPPGRWVAPGAAVLRGRALPTYGGGFAGRGAAPGPTPRARARRAGRSELCGTLCARRRSRTVWMRAFREEGKGTGENCSPSRLGSASPWPTLSDRSPRAEREGVMQDG